MSASEKFKVGDKVFLARPWEVHPDSVGSFTYSPPVGTLMEVTSIEGAVQTNEGPRVIVHVSPDGGPLRIWEECLEKAFVDGRTVKVLGTPSHQDDSADALARQCPDGVLYTDGTELVLVSDAMPHSGDDAGDCAKVKRPGQLTGPYPFLSVNCLQPVWTERDTHRVEMAAAQRKLDEALLKVATLKTDLLQAENRVSQAYASKELELEEFKKRVGRVAKEYGRRHDWCSVVDQALGDLDIEVEPQTVTFDLIVTYRVSAGLSSYREDGDVSEGWIRDSLSEDSLINGVQLDSDWEDGADVDISEVRVRNVEVSE